MERSHSIPQCARRGRPWATVVLGWVLLSTGHAEGLVIRSDHGPPSTRALELISARIGAPENSLRAFGDYFFFSAEPADPGASSAGPVSGFRATGGMVPTRPWGPMLGELNTASPSMPYVGLGYSGVWLKNHLTLNADFGLASQSSSATAPWQRPWSAYSSLDEVTRALRWGPVMAVNVNYAF